MVCLVRLIRLVCVLFLVVVEFAQLLLNTVLATLEICLKHEQLLC